jgi:Lipoprotein LpqB beta-propeller domain/Sporulation and spore germination
MAELATGGRTRQLPRHPPTGGRRSVRRWLARAWRVGLVAALVASVAGCVGMPDSGSPGTFSATPQDTTQAGEFIGAIPAGPEPGWTPVEIVQGFLNASASYPQYKDIAGQYLTSTAVKAWDPGWSVTVVNQVNLPGYADIGPGGRQATVAVTGTVRASFNGTGQYVGAQPSSGGTQPARGRGQQANQPFHLVKVDGQWRITNPPHFRLLNQSDFSDVYRPQDLYFFDPTGQVLVPVSVFVPSGTLQTSLVNNLVQALLNDPQTRWLSGGTSATSPAVTEFPNGIKASVGVDGATATVNLTGPAANVGNTVLEQISAQLVWTLTGQQTGPPNIQAVQLETNGKVWTPSSPPCPGEGQNLSPAQKLAMYSCKNPYPAATSPAFYYVGNGQAWSRCAPESQVITGSIGSQLPVFGKTSAAALTTSCGSSVQASTKVTPPPPPRGLPALSMVAVSPDSKYAAGVTPGGGSVVVWAAGATKPFSTLTMPGVTAIGWDRLDYLWVIQNNATAMVVVQGTSSNQDLIQNSFEGKIFGLSIAPDGVRVAAIVQTAAGPQVQLAAINRVSGTVGKPTSPFTSTSIGQAVRLGPNITNPIALTWYNADNLLVLDGVGSKTTLWEVPVDGQPAAQSPGVLPGAISITANSAQNALVVGLSSNELEVSAGLEGPWQVLGNGGQNPAFPTPAYPSAAQS